MSLLVASYLIGAGILLSTGLQFIAVALAGHRSQLHVAFAITCFAATGYQLAVVQSVSAGGALSVAASGNWQFLCTVVYLVAFFCFVAIYTEQRRIFPWLMLVLGFFGGLAVLRLFAPYGVRLSGAAMAFPRLGANLLLLWSVCRTVMQYRRGERRLALFLGVCIALLVISSFWGILISLKVINSFPIAGFAYIALALFMGTGLALELRDRAKALQATADSLRLEVGLRVQSEQLVRRMAYHDPLTGIANRARFQECLTETLERAARTGTYGGLLMLDLDHFKTINDALTHAVGDQVLQEIARRLQALAEPGYVARFGGDEFVLVMRELSADPTSAAQRARALAEAMIDELAKPVKAGGLLLNVRASIGIAALPDLNATALDILRQADMALYRAKKLGRGRIQLYEAPMRATAEARLQLEKGLSAALQNNGLQLVFQPQLDLQGASVGAEALVRWFHPDLGEIPPTTFIPVAEETGLIHELGTWVLDQACAALSRWLASGIGYRGRLSVNVSPYQFARQDFVAQVQQTLRKQGTDPHNLTLELTESALLVDLSDAVAKLQALRAIGVMISLDDFGTGYSSFAYLRDLPLDELKIDRAFVTDLDAGTNHALVQGMVAVGRHMALHVIAEGVETLAQRDLLTSFGCERFQGHFFSAPLKEQAFLPWLAQNRAARPPAALSA